MKGDNKMDFCKFFSDIEKDPTAIVPPMTVRQLLEAREHVMGCDTCFNRTERVLKKAPKKSDIGFFPN